jgi:hypothetical protein
VGKGDLEGGGVGGGGGGGVGGRGWASMHAKEDMFLSTLMGGGHILEISADLYICCWFCQNTFF